MTEEKKDEQILQRYELIYLISNKFAENELEPITSTVLKLIKDNGGMVIAEENWGKKKLAYPIEKFFHAYYYLIDFDLDLEKLEKINKNLRLTDEILRHLIVRKRIKTTEEIEKEKKTAERITKQEQEEKEQREQKEQKKKNEDKKDDRKVSMDELDQKLDKILDQTDNLL